ncbi:hypothetical protein [Mammaliicoccus lentus]|uniref:hypothetical protein n=1 Tax=Mammaliicoccus lentus TaxID=42858 RepID=UPI00107283B3|nr:hypothetical protein [Mammaliicoccus lentus]MBF0793339.1 hypothetical protein [Mammaliicoccus lentus]TFV17840.1 hypothetical protein E4T78_01645 [Mammaliicoccus lentus]
MKVTLMIGENKVELDGVSDIKIDDKHMSENKLDNQIENIFYKVLSTGFYIYSFRQNRFIHLEKNTVLKLCGETESVMCLEDSLGERFKIGLFTIECAMERVVDDELTNVLFNQSRDMLFNQLENNRLVMSEE